MVTDTPATQSDANRRPQLRLWDGVIPDALGIGVMLLVVAGLGIVALVADQLLQREAQGADLALGNALATTIASRLAPLNDESSPQVGATLEALRGALPFQSVRWTDKDGHVRYEWQTARQATASAAQSPDAAAVHPGQLFTAPVLDACGVQTGQVTVSRVSAAATRHRSVLFGLWGAATFLSLIGYFAIYRRLQRHVRPLAAIQNNLQRYASGMERELLALSLSDSLGSIAQCWNQLVSQLASLQQHGAPAAGAKVGNEALSRFENRTLRRMFDRLPVGVVRFSTDQQIKYANAAAAKLLGVDGEKMIGGALSEFVGEECASPLLGSRQLGNKPHTIDKRIGDDENAVLLRMQILPWNAGAQDDPLLMMQDITRMQEAERARDDFLYHVTHELRTPLTNIQAYTETLSQPDFDDEQTRKECYNVITSETRRLSNLVEEILSLSQLEVGSLRITWSDVDLVRLLRGMVQDNLGRADEKQIDLTLRLPPKVPNIRGDKERLATLLNNLIGNALKYTDSGGKVDVVLDALDHCVRIAVSDTGLGISPEDQQHVFDKFFRATSDEVREVKGTGLGLAIAREVARLHGGDIELESELGTGSTFTVKLPFNTDEGQ
ncbi:MAG: PAS domain-containing protein [Phycisphaerae bacterium]|nr:PAS domain-containing protein [Phycisphaerae bacterium]